MRHAEREPDPVDPDDAELVRRFLAEGAESAFRALFRRHTPRLYGLALRLSGWSSAEAEEVVQETWIRAAEGLAGFAGHSRLGTWLAGIVANVSREQRRRMRSRPTVPLPSAREPAPWETIYRAREDERIALERALVLLPDGYRRVLVLHDVEGFTHAEIGTLLGIEEGTSKSQLGKARGRLRELLADRQRATKGRR